MRTRRCCCNMMRRESQKNCFAATARIFSTATLRRYCNPQHSKSTSGEQSTACIRCFDTSRTFSCRPLHRDTTASRCAVSSSSSMDPCITPSLSASVLVALCIHCCAAGFFVLSALFFLFIFIRRFRNDRRRYCRLQQQLVPLVPVRCETFPKASLRPRLMCVALVRIRCWGYAGWLTGNSRILRRAPGSAFRRKTSSR